MQSFVQYAPTEVVFGKGVENQAGALAKKYHASKVLVVYGGKSAKESGLLDTICKSLEAEGVTYTELGGVKPNPRMSLVRVGVEKALSFGAELILAVGGGSAIDTAKAVAIGAASPGIDVRKFWDGEEPVTKALPIGVVLTIAAAGSEMSDSVVLTNDEIGKKSGVNSNLIRPRFALMNPELTRTLPKYQLTCGIVDIFMHTIERYFTPVGGNELTDEIAEGLMRTLIRNGRKAYEDPQDYDALSEIMWCGSVSHNDLTGLGRPKDFACHKLGHEIGGMFDEAHGATLSAVWGSWARYVYHLDVDRFAHYGEKVWNIKNEEKKEAAIAAIEATEKFFLDLNMPVCIGQLGIGIQPDEVLRRMAEKATKGDTVKLGCFKKLDMQDMYEIYKAANHG